MTHSCGWRCSIMLCATVFSSALLMHAEDHSPAAWKRLSRDAAARHAALSSLIKEARSKNVNTDYASVSAQVVSAFRIAAQHDREHVERVRRIFRTFGYFARTDPAEADRLPFNELNACLAVADHAMAELRRQMAGRITLQEAPDISNGDMKLQAGYYRLDGRVVFPSSLVWMPKAEGFMQAFGRLGECYYHLGYLRQNGSLHEGALKRIVHSLTNQCHQNAAPVVLFMGSNPAGWMQKDYPEILTGARHFTKHDIDNPLIRTWIRGLCRELLPEVSRVCGRRPQMHLLANEPHFATRKGGWLARNGVSDFTLQKYRKWMAARYRTVDRINQTYGTSFETMEHVTVKLPIHRALRGGPVWYDWCRFNMDRVNDWFTFLKNQVQANDLQRSPVTIKMLGFTLSTSDRDHGLDIEYLTKLQDIPGADLRVVPHDAVFYGKREAGVDPETDWRSRYAYNWVEQSMYLDFTKSLCPDKLFYDSEWHGFGAVSWRHFRLDRRYVRSALWLAFCHGMGAIKPWLWGRGADGALRESADHIGELSTQPIALDAYGRVLKELNAHAERVVAAVPDMRRFVIYYCEEAAIQEARYTGGFKDVYEALKLLNLSVGFATPSSIGGLDAGRQVLVVPPTRFIADASLRGINHFQQSGGRVMLINAGRSFEKDELGKARSGVGMGKPFLSLPLKSVMALTEHLDAALAAVKPALPVDLAVSDAAGKRAYGVIGRQARDKETGEPFVILNNVSRHRRTVELKRRKKSGSSWMDVITSRPVSGSIVLEPCEVRLLKNGP